MAGPRGAAPSPASLPPAERFSGLIRLLQASVVLAVVLAVAGLVVDPPGWGLFVVVVVAPLVRVGWLAVRWWARGDPRYGSIAAGLLAMIAVVAVVTAWLA